MSIQNQRASTFSPLAAIPKDSRSLSPAVSRHKLDERQMTLNHSPFSRFVAFPVCSASSGKIVSSAGLRRLR